MLRKILFVTAVMIFIQSLNADLDWNITGSGARAAGMGNAFIGIADDATAINWNPGGLTALEHFEASVVGAWVTDIEEYSFTDNIGTDNNDDFFYDHLNFNFLSMAYPMTLSDRKLVIAAAFQKQLDFFSEDEQADELNNYSYRYESEGGIYTANLGAGYQVLPYLSVGATANIWMGGSESNHEEAWDTYVQTAYAENNNFSGFNLVLGTVFDMSAIKENVPLKLGLVLKTPFDLDYDYYYEFSDTDGYSYTEEISGTVEMPFMFGMGASYRFGENFTVGIDFERRNYAKSKFKWEDDITGDTGESYMSATEDDVTQFRFGMEYLIITDAVVVPVRLGIFSYPTLWANEDNQLYYQGDDTYGNPIYESDFDASTLEQLVGTGISLGTGVIFESFSLDLSFSLFSYENTYANYFVDGPWGGYDSEESWTNTKATMNMSAVIYLDQFIKK
jgi:hypothetical protein